MPTAEPPTTGWSLRRCVTYTWGRFHEEAAALILATLAVLVVVGGLEVLVVVVTDDLTASLTADLTTTLAAAFTGFVALLLAQVGAVPLVRAALTVTAGRALRAADLLITDRIVPAVLTAAIISGAATVGFLLLHVIGVLILHATGYALFFVLDRSRSATEAIGDSIRLVAANLADTTVWFVVAALLVTVGALALLVGLVVALPLALLGTAFTYRTLVGGPAPP